METKVLGNSDLRITPNGFGAWAIGGDWEFGWGAQDDARSIAAIHRALELGVNFLDTADMYGPYTNEELVGRAIRGKRDRFVIATKFGIVRGPDPTSRAVSGKPDYLRSSCEGSLKRLGIETIDFYYQHRVDPNTPIEDTVGAMAQLVKEGKVRFLGLSEASPETLRRACKVHPIAGLQTEYSLWSRDPEDEILASIELEFQPATWRAFQLLALESAEASAVAAELGISLNAVYLAKYRVLRRLRQEAEGLLD